MRKLLERFDLQPFFVPIDTQGASGGHISGDWLNVKDCRAFSIVVIKEAGTANDDPTLTVVQATDASGTGSKALNFTEYFSKQSAGSTETLTAVGTWTRNTQSAGNTIAGNSTSAESSLMWVINFDIDELDVDGGFYFVNATIADTGAAGAQWACCFLLKELQYQGAPANHVSLIA